ncbi:hypothetical protein V9K67_08850 [Paraflavisolibacter sp. H34]|uniref:hypothetical protein n=1 Tax=Huijunlia imazamoxiresistens TaxID=3127457 RepID=UPI003016559C
MKKLIVAFCATLLIVAGCKKDKDEDEEEVVPTVTSLAGNYKVTEYTFKYRGRTVNFLDSMEVCNRDDVMTLKTDKSYTWSDAGTTCNPTGSFAPGTWDLATSKKFLWDGDLYDLDTYDGKSLVISQTDIDSLGNLAVVKAAFQKQ